MKKIILTTIIASSLTTMVNANYIFNYKIDKSISENFKTEESYQFNSHTFTNCGVTAYYGPTLSDCINSYSNSWVNEENNFNIITQGIQEWRVPETGNYKLTLQGASGGNTSLNDIGGRGIIIEGVVNLTKDTILRIIVGSRGGNYSNNAGGGGASAVYIKNETIPLIIAAGGGGGGASGGNGCNAVLSNLPVSCNINYGVNIGNGGGNSSNGGWGTGGAGWYSGGLGAPNQGLHNDWSGSKHSTALNSTALGGTATHGIGYINSLHDFSNSGSCFGAPGGFGGGGSGQCNGAGAGGGYSGGSAGGAGGGSFVDSSKINNVVGNTFGNNLENGLVKIEKL